MRLWLECGGGEVPISDQLQTIKGQAMTARAKVARCQSCRWWDRSNNFRAIGRDWGLCHLWGGKSGARLPNGFIDFSFGHEPLGSDTCEHHNADPIHKQNIQRGGAMPQIKCEGKLP